MRLPVPIVCTSISLVIKHIYVIAQALKQDSAIRKHRCYSSWGSVWAPCQLRTSAWPKRAPWFTAVIRSCQSEELRLVVSSKVFNIKNLHFQLRAESYSTFFFFFLRPEFLFTSVISRSCSKDTWWFFSVDTSAPKVIDIINVAASYDFLCYCPQPAYLISEPLG